MNQFRDEEIACAVYEATNRRTYVMAYCHTDEAARLGVRSIEHGSGIRTDTTKLIVENTAFIVPTLTVVNVLRTDGAEVCVPPEIHRPLRENAARD